MLGRLRSWITEGVDLDAVVRAARTAPPLRSDPWDPAAALGPGVPEAGLVRPVIAMAAGEAFTFRYTENVELLRAAGAEVVDIDPLNDEALPAECAGLYFGGGFPEVHAEPLTSNDALRNAVTRLARNAADDDVHGREHVRRPGAAGGVPIVAECAGLTYLCRDLDGYPMTGVLDASARMTERRTLGYRTATAACDNVLTHAGEQVTGHEFHRTQVTPRHGEAISAAWTWADTPEGFAAPLLHASYLHVHWAGHPHLARRFADAARSIAR